MPDNPAGMSTLHLKRQLNEVKTLVSELSETVSGHGETLDRLNSRVNSLSNMVNMYGNWIQDIDDRLSDVEVTSWRYHKREKFVARLVAIGYTTEMAEETVDELFTNGCGNGGAGNGNTETEQGVALREQLATLRYTPTEIEECIEDVPGITEADIDYAKEILDAWDPATTSLADAYKNNTQLVIFPKIDTSNVTNLNSTFQGCTNLKYVPWFDTSKVTTVTFSFGWRSEYTALRRLPDLKWPSLKRGYGPYTGLRSLAMMPAEPFDLSAATFLSCTFGYSRIPASFPGVRFNTDAPLQLDQFFVETIIDGELPITELPDNVTQFSATYANSRLAHPDLSGVIIRARGATNGPNRLFANVNLTYAPRLDMPMANNFKWMFAWCHYLLIVPDYTSSAPETMEEMLCGDYGTYPLERVEGLNFARVTNATIFGTGTTSGHQKPYLRYMRIVNLGQSELASYDFSLATVWGTGSEEARQSLVNSLLTDSYDRGAAGMAPATVRLSTASKAALTAEEIAAITAKGFTIA